MSRQLKSQVFKPTYGKKLTYEEVKNRVEHRGWKLLSNEYKNARTKLKMECPNGHITEKTLDSFNISDCKECQKSTQSKIQEEIEKDGYTLLSTYTNVHEKILVRCSNGHEPYEVMLCNWRRGTRCPKCNESKGEKRVRSYLDSHKITFIAQHTFKDCKHINLLEFDFYIPSLNVCIEYDGEQHFKPQAHFGGEERFKTDKIRDEIKNKYCKDNDIELIRIPYWDYENIETILNNLL